LAISDSANVDGLNAIRECGLEVTHNLLLASCLNSDLDIDGSSSHDITDRIHEDRANEGCIWDEAIHATRSLCQTVEQSTIQIVSKSISMDGTRAAQFLDCLNFSFGRRLRWHSIGEKHDCRIP